MFVRVCVDMGEGGVFTKIKYWVFLLLLTLQLTKFILCVYR